MSIEFNGNGLLTGLLAIPETATITATAPPSTTNLDVLTQSVLYYTTNASANFTLNIRGNAGTTFASICDVGKAFTVVLMVTNGATPYWPTAFQIDGASVTPKWGGGTAPTGGNANSIDVYTYTVIKTAATPTYTVLATQVQFA